MVTLIEKFEVLGVGRLGIEDYESLGYHFFPGEYKSGKCGRYRVWNGGSSFGTADTLEEAREGVLRYVVKALCEQREEFALKLEVIAGSLYNLRLPTKEHPDTFNLKKFQVDVGKNGKYTNWDFDPKE